MDGYPHLIFESKRNTLEIRTAWSLRETMQVFSNGVNDTRFSLLTYPYLTTTINRAHFLIRKAMWSGKILTLLWRLTETKPCGLGCLLRFCGSANRTPCRAFELQILLTQNLKHKMQNIGCKCLRQTFHNDLLAAFVGNFEVSANFLVAVIQICRDSQ